jgi:hypothetical protein
LKEERRRRIKNNFDNGIYIAKKKKGTLLTKRMELELRNVKKKIKK